MTELDRILAKGLALFGIKRKCNHAATTLVQHIDDEYGWFACYQCDRCGQITRKDVSADDLDTANDAPWLDVAMYEQATIKRLPGETTGRALAFFWQSSEVAMATGSGPQKENGYTAIANEIMEALSAAPLRGQQFRCVMFLFRQTYGFNKKEDTISLAAWERGTKLKRQNVWRELELLIKSNVIYKKSNGPKRPNTWGFNKHYREWNFDSVITDDYKSVITDDDNPQQSVITDDYKSVITPHERTKDIKSKQQPAASVDDEDGDSTMALVRLAYQNVCGIGPSRQTDEGKANMVTATRLIDRYGFTTCVRGLSTVKERNDAMIRKNVRNRIRNPIAYLQTVLEDEDTPPANAVMAVSTLDFALEEIAL